MDCIFCICVKKELKTYNDTGDAMKLLLSIFFVFQVVCSKVEFYGGSYLVYDSYNDYVVESSNENKRQSVASISKIMTAILVIENSRLDKKIIVDETINKAYGSCVYIHIKDKMTIQDLLYGLMLRSGNDCALMLAKSVGGSVNRFVEMMNEKARDIGMKQKLYKQKYINVRMEWVFGIIKIVF